MPHSLSVPSPAKINLFLHIIGRTDNGYHKLQTLFQLLDFGDTVHLESIDNSEIRLNTALDGVAKADNIAVKAAQLLQSYSGTKHGVAISIDKQLPMGGGLGGGSSNAASTLLGLNKLWQLGLSQAELANISVKLGADVPVFVMGQNSLAEGIGEQLHPISLPNMWYVVVKPPVNVETATIFSHPQLTRDTLPIRIAAFFRGGENSLVDSLYSNQRHIEGPMLKNDCEKVVCKLHPEVATAMKWLSQHGKARLTGTGACIFASFNSEQEATNVYSDIPKPMTGFVAQSSQRSIAHRSLDL